MNLNTLTLTQAQEGLKKKKFSSLELVIACLNRIKESEKKLHAFMTICESVAIQQAKKADRVIAKGEKKPLLGIPISIKDNFCTKGVRTTASSKVLDNFIPPYDATVVKRLKDAGAIIIGKTNMDAWAHGSSTETSAYGPTKNPWDITKLPGGSSGGSAASVAADGVIVSVGSETAGSIRQPASWCGVVGLKPTYGRVSRYGLISMGSSLDSPGPLAKTVKDAAIMLEVLAGCDQYDATTSKRKVDKYSKSLSAAVKGMTIGVPQEYLDVAESGVREKIEEAVKAFEKLGASVKPIHLLHPKYAIAVYTIIQRAEVSSNLARFDGIRYGYGRDRFGHEAKKRIMLGTYTLSAGYYDAYYKKAQKVRTAIIKDLEKAFKNVDLIIGPTSPSVALPLGSSKKHPMFGEVADVLVEASTIAGLPGINVPCGFSNGLPVGLQIFGPQFCETQILQVAHAYEQATHWHKKKPSL